METTVVESVGLGVVIWQGPAGGWRRRAGARSGTAKTGVGRPKTRARPFVPQPAANTWCHAGYALTFAPRPALDGSRAHSLEKTPCRTSA